LLSKEVRQGLEIQGVTFIDECPEFHELMKLTYKDLAELETFEVAKYIYIISQYIVYLVQIRNAYRIDYKKLSDEANRIIDETKGKTKADKKREAFKDERLKKLIETLDILQAYNTQFTDLIESHRDIQNALKYIYNDKALEFKSVV
jgi:hypothetical protein